MLCWFDGIRDSNFLHIIYGSSNVSYKFFSKKKCNFNHVKNKMVRSMFGIIL